MRWRRDGGSPSLAQLYGPIAVAVSTAGAERHHRQMTGHGVETAADRQDDSQDEKSEAQRKEVALLLGKAPAEHRGEGVNETQASGENKVFHPTEPEPFLHEEVNIIEIAGGGDGVEAGHDQNAGFDGGRIH